MFISLPLLFILFNSKGFELFSCSELSLLCRAQELHSQDTKHKTEVEEDEEGKDIWVVILATLCAIKISFSAYLECPLGA